MHLIDISNDIQMDNVTGLREAFRALACGEDVVLDDNADPITDEQRGAVLAAIYDRLAGDGSIMPSGSCAELDLPAGTTYGEAVAQVRGGASV